MTRPGARAFPVAACSVGLFAAVTLSGAAGTAVGPNVKGKISGQDKLVPDVYAEAAKIEAHRWTWREPSPSVQQQFRALSPNPSRDICIAATKADNNGPGEAIQLKVTGGRVYPTTIAIAPGTPLVFKNYDPFKHRLYVVNQQTMKADDTGPGASRTWSPPGPGKYELRDELFPSVRTFVVVDPQVASIAYPGRDGAFVFALAGGEYVLKAYFNGRMVGKPVTVVAKDKGAPFELKEPFNVGEGTDAK